MKTSRSPNRVSLPRALSKLGFASRSAAQNLIVEGSVLVNGRVERNPHCWVNLERDRISVKGTEVIRAERRYLLLHKPVGVVTTASDEKGRATVLDLLGEEGRGLMPVGRLDKDTSGLLLLTNDHELGDFLTAPLTAVPKTYAVTVDRPIRREDCSRIRHGVSITVNGRPYTTKPAETRILDRESVELVISEGKNRQIRKMFEVLGYQMMQLHRVAIGPLRLAGLREGEFRPLTPDEIVQLAHLKKPQRPLVPKARPNFPRNSNARHRQRHR